METLIINFASIILLILVISESKIIGKNLKKLKIEDKDSVYSHSLRNLENDNYMVLYFNHGYFYSSGFVNEYRNDIDFIINKRNNMKYKKEDPFNVVKDFGIEIHFNKIISSLYNFFSAYKDNNMKYLSSVDFSRFDSTKVINMRDMFYNCSSLEYFDLSNFDTSQVTNMRFMFYNCSSLKSIDLSNFDTSEVTDMDAMFYGCSSLKSLYLSNFNTSKVTNMGYMFYYCSSLKSIDLSSFDTSKVIYMDAMFYNCSLLKSIDLSRFDTSQVIEMDFMFYYCSLLKSIDLSNFDTSEVIDMNAMFYECSSLISIDLSNFDTSQVIRMGFMFYNCSSLKSIDLSYFDTSKVTDMDAMFYGCSSLESIDLSNFDTSNVSDMGFMFKGCSSLISIDLSNFDTSKVTDMGYMFKGCSSLESIDLSNFNMIKCNSYDTFADISNIKYINLYYFKNDKILSDYFNNKNNSIFICQKDKIIKSPLAHNCCDSNFKTYDCISSNNEINNNISKTTKTPRVIIGIIAGGIIFAVIIIITIYCCIKKRCVSSLRKSEGISIKIIPPSQPPTEHNENDTNSSRIINFGFKPNIFEHEPQKEKEHPMIIIFQNPIFGETRILIDSKKTIDELIKFYFDICGKKDLYGDKNIYFLIGGNSIIIPYPKESVETLKIKIINSEPIIIVVADICDKMKK